MHEFPVTVNSPGQAEECLGLGATVLEGFVPIENSLVEIVRQEWPEILIWVRL